jgi:NADPH:quinone reductase-like Zn-dependent oxidoreductase
MGRAVRFDRFGNESVLHIEEVPPPTAGRGEAVVRVKVAGVNIGEVPIREGRMEALYATEFPSGEGTDFAGVVAEVGPGVTDVRVGDEVIGWTDQRAAQADAVAVPANHLVPKPERLPWEVAGGLFVAASTAWAAVHAVGAGPGDTVVVSAAAGGVGGLAAQLARHRGATVIGIAGPDNQDWLASVGIIPIEYGDGVAGRIQDAAPDGVDAFIDTFGDGYVDLAIALGVRPERINTIIDFDAATTHNVKTDGTASAERPEVLAEMAGLLADGELELPIAATFPLEQVGEAYTQLAQRHTRGKIVLAVS